MMIRLMNILLLSFMLSFPSQASQLTSFMGGAVKQTVKRGTFSHFKRYLSSFSADPLRENAQLRHTSPLFLKASTFPVSTSFYQPLYQSRCFFSQSAFLSSQPILIGNPCIDGVFQYGFKSSIVLSDFLNTVLDFKGDNAIKEIEYLDPRFLPSDTLNPLAYPFTVDVRCRTKNDHHFIIEMQNDFRDDYHLKALIEHARLISQLDLNRAFRADDQSPSYRFWKNIHGFYTIVITNKAFSPKTLKSFYTDEPLMEPFLVNRYELRHTQKLERHYGDTNNQLVLFMLANLTTPLTSQASDLEKWAYVLKDPSLRSGRKKIAELKEVEDIELIAGNNMAIREFISRLRRENLPAEVWDRYIRALTYYNDTITDMTQKAKQEGLKEGREEEKIRIARQLLLNQVPVSVIQTSTNLTEEEINNLRKNL